MLERSLFEAKRVLVGQDHMIERLFVCWLARGHALIEGAPGLAKTLAAETIARVLGGSFARLQFTPDLVPADLIGTRIYRPSSEQFNVELGPVFANVVLADEINRAPAKVQSALLEVMAERQVSIGGTSYPVPSPFLVMATQNPIEHEGVYPLPEAQRDRFLLKILIDFPSAREEAEIVRRMSVSPPQARQVLDGDQLAELQAMADSVFVHDAVVDYAVRLVAATRTPAEHALPDLSPLIAHGASPRATLGLVAGGRALALLRGRTYTLPQERLQRRTRRAASPGAAQLRGPRRRDGRRVRGGADRAHRAGAARRPVAGPGGRQRPGRRRRRTRRHRPACRAGPTRAPRRGGVTMAAPAPAPTAEPRHARSARP